MENRRKFKIVVYVSIFILIMLVFSCLGKGIRLQRLEGNFVISIIKSYRSIVSFHPFDLIIGAIISAPIVAYIFFESKKAMKTATGEEYGDAKWGKSSDIKPFIDKDFFKNIIISKDIRLMTNNRPKNWKLQRNKNVKIQGSTGQGKTRYILKPNILQMNQSYVVVDSKGTVMPEVAHAFEVNNYNIKVFNTINFYKSMHYDPLAYIRSEKDILSFTTTLILNTEGDKPKPGTEDFWVKAEKLLYNAVIAYMFTSVAKEDRTLPKMIELLDMLTASEDEDEAGFSVLEIMFEILAEENPNCFAIRQWKKYKKASGKTAKSILISCGTRLAPFDIKEIRNICSYDEMCLDRIGIEKTILFLIISDNDPTFNFLIAIMFSQMFTINMDLADDKYGGELPIPIQIHIDEFYNVGTLPNFDKKIGTIRSRGLSAFIYLQSDEQLTAKYEKIAPVISDNFDSYVYLGGGSPETVKKISDALGKETVEVRNHSRSYGSQGSSSISYQKTGRALMSPNKIREMPRDKMIYFLTGCSPFYTTKYDLTSHPNYKLTGDYDKKNMFDVEAYVKNRHKIKLKKSDQYDVIEVN
ncbi:MAG: type IV secretory system conjugative DNA transfer family protein [Clostridiales bacterium]|nr:type IV secretory system conjugative DNA transfer family protein [Clostridiales bacterium]